MGARLGVNIDHVATLRQARGEDYPSLVRAAHEVLEAGAHQITIHLREDRRHIQDYDVAAIKLVCERYGRPLNLEMGANEEIFQVAVAAKPDWICLVPEKREERTTEGGLDLGEKAFGRIKDFCEKIKLEIPSTKISLFVEADSLTMEQCLKLQPDAVEIHTGEYARTFNRGEPITKYIELYNQARSLLGSGIGFHAGHGLDDKNIIPLLEFGKFHEYNVGHWLICESLFGGLSQTVDKYLALIQKYGEKA